MIDPELRALYEQTFNLEPGKGLTDPDAPSPVTCSLNGTHLPGQPTVTVSGGSNITQTPLAGRNGTVKVLYGRSDYQITIKGAILGTNDAFPAAEVTALKNLLETPGAMTISSEAVQPFGITYVAVTDYAFPSAGEDVNFQPYEIHALSDEQD